MFGNFPEFKVVAELTYQQGTADVTSEVQRLVIARQLLAATGPAA